MAKEQINLVWLKKDLRATDHLPLWSASQRCLYTNTPALILYTLEENYWKTEKASQEQKNFVLESLQDLKNTLAPIGAKVHLLQDPSALQTFQRLLQNFDIQRVYSHLETGNEWTFQRDIKIKKLLQKQRILWLEFPQYPIQRGNQPAPNFSKPTTPKPTFWLNPKTTLHSLPILPEIQSPLIQKGGETKAQSLLQSFLNQRCFEAQGYRKSLGNPLEAPHCCSRLSPHLTWGTLSIKTLLQIPSPTQPKEKLQRDAFEARLHWRNHFLQGFEHRWEMEKKCLNPKAETLRGWNEETFQRWAHGQTGYPFIDACIRSLNATKWLHFRARAMITSFAAYGLNLDWRGFGPHLARNFLDYEPGIHYWQLQMQSGTTLHSPPRIYNPIKQSLEKDPEGTFIKTWVPELKDFSKSQIHLPLNPPRNYPKPLIAPEALWTTFRKNALKKETHCAQLELF